MITAIYARTSTDRQEREETVKSQLAACEAFAAANQASVAHTFVDDGVSGATLTRPALAQLRDAIRAKRIARLIIYDTDRLSRNLSHLLILMEEINRAGVEVLFVKCPLEDTPEGRVLFNIKGVFAEYEREKIRERTLRGKVSFIKQGGWFGPPPYGYSVVDQRLQVDPVEAHWVREIFALYADGGTSLHELARYLTNHGVPTRKGSKKWNGWQPEVIRRILTRELYTGVFRRRLRGIPDSECEVAVPALVDRTTWQGAQKRLLQNKIESARNKVHFYLLSGLLRCGVCGNRFYGRVRHRTAPRYYICETAHDRAHSRVPCDNNWIRADALEAAVWKQVVDLITRPEAVLIGEQFLADAAQTDGKATLDEQLFVVRRGIAKVETKKSRALDLILERPQDKSILAAKLADMDRETNQLRERERSLMDGLSQVASREERLEAIRQAFRSLRPRLDTLLPDDRRQVCRLLLEEVRAYRRREVRLNWLIPVTEVPDPDASTAFAATRSISDGLGAVVTQDSPR
jgi:site-specific DNA recombinase